MSGSRASSGPSDRTAAPEDAGPRGRRLMAWATSRPGATILLVAVTVAVRLAYVAKSGIVAGGDTSLYLRIGESFADGAPTTGGFPAHVLYGIMLAPSFLLGIGLETWVTVLHLACAVATAVLVHRTALLFAGPLGSLAVGLATGLLPTAVFWSNYILTETLFLLVMAAFAYACARTLSDPRLKFALAAPLATATLLLVTRPVGLPVAAAGLGFVLWALVAERAGERQARRVVTAAVALALIAATAVMAAPPTRDAVLSNKTIVASLWNSTRIWHAGNGHVSAGVTLPEDIARLSPADQREEQRERALNYIGEQPAEYLGKASIRFASFWFPWATATWSPAHKLTDLLLPVALIGLALYSLVRPPPGCGRRIVYLLAALALVQGVLVMFSQIDTEGRYRLPAELVLLPLAALAVDRIALKRRSGRQAA